MRNKGMCKKLPWPENLWSEVFGFGERVIPPEDWEDVLPLFTDSLSDLRKQILFGWYRDKKTAKQLEIELKCTGVASRKCAIDRKMWYDWGNRNFYLYGKIKSKLMPSVYTTLLEGAGLDKGAAFDLTAEIAANTTIAQMNTLEREMAAAVSGEGDKYIAVEDMLRKYGLTMLKTFKFRNEDDSRLSLAMQSLAIIKEQLTKIFWPNELSALCRGLLLKIRKAICCFLRCFMRR